MPNHCVAAGCTNSSTIKGISVYHFPKDLSLRKKWVDQVKRTRDKWTGPSEHSILCSDHFSDDCFEASYDLRKHFGIQTPRKRQLKPNAVPSIFKRHISFDDASSTTCTVQPPPKKRSRVAYEKRERKRVYILIYIIYYDV